MIQIQNGSKSFGSQTVLHDLNLKFTSAGLYILSGKSGCGKSTLLNIIAGYDVLSSGKIEVTDSVMTIFQNYELIPELTVFDNIFLGYEASEENLELLRKLDILSLKDQYPDELSGGQKQRVGIARAMISKPSIICCDEPTESLDIENKKIVLDILKEYSKDHIVIMATHQEDTILHYADYLLKFENGTIHRFRRKNFQSSEPIPSIRSSLTEKEVYTLVCKIIHKKHTIFQIVFVLLLLLTQSMSLFRQILFHIPDTHLTLNADMVYLQTDMDEQQRKDAGIQKTEKILSFHNISRNGTEYITGIYPYVENTENLKITGTRPEGMHVLINQNTAKAMFENDWQNQPLQLTYSLDTETLIIDVTVTGLIEEPDTDAMNIYYDLDSMKDYLAGIRSSLNIPLIQIFEEKEDHYQYRTDYERMGIMLEKLASFTSYNPLYTERENLRASSLIYVYLFNAIILVVFGLLILFTISYTRKETESFCRDFIILMSQNISLHFLKKEYLSQTFLPLVIFTIVDVIALILLHVKISYLSVNIMILLAIIISAAGIITTLIQLSSLKEEKISSILKG